MTEILLIEDIDSDAELLIDALEIAGIANPVRRLASGADALIHVTSAATISPVACSIPSVVFLDLKLPKINGLVILEQIVRTPAFAGTLRIVLSHLNDIKTIKRAYNLGAHTFLAKPIHQTDITELIRVFPGYWTFDALLAPGGDDHAQPRTNLLPSRIFTDGPAAPISPGVREARNSAPNLYRAPLPHDSKASGNTRPADKLPP